jgi:hypothetical protein
MADMSGTSHPTTNAQTALSGDEKLCSALESHIEDGFERNISAYDMAVNILLFIDADRALPSPPAPLPAENQSDLFAKFEPLKLQALGPGSDRWIDIFPGTTRRNG